MSENGTALKINVGCGDKPMPDWENVDRKNGSEAYPLDYPDQSADVIRASHILEHFGYGEVFNVLLDWFRVLKPGGTVRIAVPDYEYSARNYFYGNGNRELLMRYTMGGQIDDNDFHKSAWDEVTLSAALKQAGFRNIRRWQSDFQDCSSLPCSLNLEATRPEAREPVKAPKIIACMSTGRIGFTENLHCAMQVLGPLGVNLLKHTGAFWGHGLERAFEQAIEQGAEWILTLDFDTVFTARILEELCYLLGTNEHVDAIAPWQAKRECDYPLAWFMNDDGSSRGEVPLSEIDEKPLSRVKMAHFGLTLLRVESLKKVSRPWFWSKPNDDGTWGEGRTDDDIYFWQKWYDAGNTLYVANDVSIGHLQQVASWPRQDLTVAHQYLSDFQKDGPPKFARGAEVIC